MVPTEIAILSERVERMENYDTFDAIPEAERLNDDDLLCGLLFLQSKQVKRPFSAIHCAEHDEVFAHTSEELCDLTEADVLYLSRCGWRYDRDLDGFRAFV